VSRQRLECHREYNPLFTEHHRQNHEEQLTQSHIQLRQVGLPGTQNPFQSFEDVAEIIMEGPHKLQAPVLRIGLLNQRKQDILLLDIVPFILSEAGDAFPDSFQGFRHI